MRFASGLLIVLLSVSSYAQTAADVALLVNEKTIDAAAFAAHVTSSDALTRATAARMVTVRGLTALLPKVREALASEATAETAREQVRALALLGGEDDVAFAAKQLARYPASLDSDFAQAIARRGAPQATALYLKYLPELRHPLPGVRFALWGRTPLVAATASRFLANDDVSAFGELLDALLDALLVLNAGVMTAALRSDNAAIRAEMIWYLAHGFAADPSRLPEVAEREVTTPDEGFGREVLRRMRGAKYQQRPEWTAWLKTHAGRKRAGDGKPLLRFLTLDEQNALHEREEGEELKSIGAPAQPRVVRQSPFTVPLLLPPGLGAQLLSKTRCNDAWLGVVKATVDRTGRVQSVDSSRVFTRTACRRALDTMLLLSFADPSSIDAPLVTEDLQVVKPSDTACVDDVAAGIRRTELVRAGGEVKLPQVVNRVEPVFPMRALEKMRGNALVVAEAVITTTGCVRDLRIVGQALTPELNSSAILALAKWKFKPGTLDGQPVDVIFNLTVNYRHH